MERLYCILCLKYVGLSLAEIRSFLAGGVTPTAARKVFLDALSETEQAFSTLLSRYATLRYLAQAVGAEVPASELAGQVPAAVPTAENPMEESPAIPESQPDWRSLAQSIERYQGKRQVLLAPLLHLRRPGRAGLRGGARAHQRRTASWRPGTA